MEIVLNTPFLFSRIKGNNNNSPSNPSIARREFLLPINIFFKPELPIGRIYRISFSVNQLKRDVNNNNRIKEVARTKNLAMILKSLMVK
jgi:hypothetical protein